MEFLFTGQIPERERKVFITDGSCGECRTEHSDVKLRLFGDDKRVLTKSRKLLH